MITLLLAVSMISASASNRVLPTNGPARPLPLLRKLTFLKADIGPRWASGLFDVHLHYRTSESLHKILNLYNREAHRKVRADQNQVYDTREVGNVLQAFRESESGTQTLVDFEESLISPAGPLPPRWFRTGIGPSPTPMIRVPFSSGITTCGVTPQNLRFLESGIGFEDPNAPKDSLEYLAIIPGPQSATRLKTIKWLTAHGYHKAFYPGSYFRPGTGMFEVMFWPYSEPESHAHATYVTLYLTKDRAKSDVSLDKI